jgi:hypothetical protein
VKLRAGRRNRRNLYLQIGDQPDDQVDISIGFMVDTDTARLIGEALTSQWHLNEIMLDAQARAEFDTGL